MKKKTSIIKKVLAGVAMIGAIGGGQTVAATIVPNAPTQQEQQRKDAAPTVAVQTETKVQREAKKFKNLTGGNNYIRERTKKGSRGTFKQNKRRGL